jgi:hypothetical protein
LDYLKNRTIKQAIPWKVGEQANRVSSAIKMGAGGAEKNDRRRRVGVRLNRYDVDITGCRVVLAGRWEGPEVVRNGGEGRNKRNQVRER